jgi:putative transposase
VRARPEGLSLERAARSLGVTRSQVYRQEKPAAEAALVAQIEAVVGEHSAYGYRRVAASLGESPKRIRRVMKRAGLAARRPRRGKRTTFARAMMAAQNLVRHLKTQAPNQVWACDVTAIRIQRAWRYLAVVLDVHSRKIVGWSMSSRNDTLLTLGAMSQALALRQPPPGLIHHSDRGSHYTAPSYQSFLAQVGVKASFADPASPRQNAHVESFFRTLKLESMDEVFGDSRAAYAAVYDYIELYNRTRLHSSLQYQSPDQFETGATSG